MALRGELAQKHESPLQVVNKTIGRTISAISGFDKRRRNWCLLSKAPKSIAPTRKDARANSARHL